MTEKELVTVSASIDDITPHPKNVRQGDIGAISESLKAHGQYRAIVVQRSTGHILAGNHTWKAAKALGWKQISAHFIDCDDEKAMRILLADNRANDLATYDDAALAAVLTELNATDDGLAGTLYDGDALDQLIGDIGREETAADAPDDAPAITQVGDIWLLGEHRLMCGDSTKIDDVSRLMNGKKADMTFTDPPYGVDIVGGSHTLSPKQRRAAGGKVIKNDAMSLEETTELIVTAFTNASELSRAGACFYVCAPTMPNVLAAFMPLHTLGIWRHTLIWIKNQLVFGRMDYHYRHEAILYGWKEGAAHIMPTDRTQDSVWEVARPKQSTEHPTMKPIELMTKALHNSSHKNDIVLDIFGGSGSTLIAAHLTNRICYTIELDPHYCDIICARYQKQTGNLPQLEATGDTHNFLP